MKKLFFGLVSAFLVLAVSIPLVSNAGDIGTYIDSAKNYASYELGGLWFSPDGNHFLYGGKGTGPDGKYRDFFVFDGEMIDRHTISTASWDGGNPLSYIRFSPDGKHFAYPLFVGGDILNGTTIIYDGKEIPGSKIERKEGSIEPVDLVLAGDSYAYIVDNSSFGGDGMYVVYNGEKGKTYGSVENLTLSPDGKHFVYTVKQGIGSNTKRLVVYDNEEKQDQDATILEFSPDSKHFAYALYPKGLIYDGQSIDSDGIKRILFSPDGQRFAYSKSNLNIVVDGKEIKANSYEDTMSETMTFSPDSKHFAYIKRSNGKYFLVVDDSEKEVTCGRGEIIFSNDGKHTVIGCESLAYASQEAKVLYDGDYIDNGYDVQFSPDGKKFSYIAEGGKSVVVYSTEDSSKETGPVYTNVSDLVFSPDSKHFVYRANKSLGRDIKEVVVYDGVELEEYHSVSNLLFSPDGKYFVYVANKGGKRNIIQKGLFAKNTPEVISPLVTSKTTSPDNALVQKIDTLSKNTATANAESSKYTQEMKDAYLFGFDLGLTKSATIDSAALTTKLTRKELAKSAGIFAVKVLGLTPDTSRTCTFKDTKGQSEEFLFYMTLACQLKIMGIESDGRPLKNFEPNKQVIRADFGTVLSRLIWGDAYNDLKVYYRAHLANLKKNGIMIKIDNPKMIEERGFVMLMIQRANTYKKSLTTSTGANE